MPNKKKYCPIQVTEKMFLIQGEFYYLINKEFRRTKNKSDNCSVREYLGHATLHKRFSKKTLFFLVFAVILEIVDTIASKLKDIFFFVDNSWADYVVNVIVVLCVI